MKYEIDIPDDGPVGADQIETFLANLPEGMYWNIIDDPAPQQEGGQTYAGLESLGNEFKAEYAYPHERSGLAQDRINVAIQALEIEMADPSKTINLTRLHDWLTGEDLTDPIASIMGDLEDVIDEPFGWYWTGIAGTEFSNDSKFVYGHRRPDERASWIPVYASPQPTAEREGWVMVPRKPTTAMLDAAWEAVILGEDKNGKDVHLSGTEAHLAYRAMIEAAPADKAEE